MTTHPVSDMLSAYLDRELQADEELTVAGHLEQCSVCRHRLAELSQTSRLVRSLSVVAVPDTLRDVVRERLSGRTQTGFPRHWNAPWLTPLSAASAIALVFVAVLSIGILREATPPRTAMDATRPASPGAVEPVSKSRNFATPTLSQADRVMRESIGTPGAPPAASALQIERQAIQTASLLIAVKDVDGAGADLIEIAEAADGFVAESAGGAHTEETATFLLRVPASRFFQVLEELAKLGRVETRRVGGEDVSEQFVDLRARIRNSERREQQLLFLMGRAPRPSEIPAIEQELSRVRAEIEQLTGRLRSLSNRVDLATVEVTLRKRETPVP
jgi:hypothetical protein